MYCEVQLGLYVNIGAADFRYRTYTSSPFFPKHLERPSEIVRFQIVISAVCFFTADCLNCIANVSYYLNSS